MNFLLRLLTWWNGQTIGTQIFTWRHGILVGEDTEGNKFYENKDGTRRWVCYNGEPEASRVDPTWHGWLHGTFGSTPLKDPFLRKKWEKSHQENLTGTLSAYAPDGSLKNAKLVTRKDYEAWQPELD